MVGHTLLTLLYGHGALGTPAYREYCGSAVYKSLRCMVMECDARMMQSCVLACHVKSP